MKMINQSLAIIVGIDEYLHIRKLTNAASDAEALAEVLEKSYGYKVLCLKNEKTTHQALRDLLDNLKGSKETIQFPDWEIIKPDWKTIEPSCSRILFYFAGHGFSEKAENSEEVKPAGYLMLQDSQEDDKNTWLPMQELHDVFTRLACHHLLIILDCCFAGSIRWAGLKRNAARARKMYRQSYDRFIKYPAQQVIISAASDEKAQDTSRFGKRGKNNEHSPFAHYCCRC